MAGRKRPKPPPHQPLPAAPGGGGACLQYAPGRASFKPLSPQRLGGRQSRVRLTYHGASPFRRSESIAALFKRMFDLSHFSTTNHGFRLAQKIGPIYDGWSEKLGFYDGLRNGKVRCMRLNRCVAFVVHSKFPRGLSATLLYKGKGQFFNCVAGVKGCLWKLGI